MLLKINHLTEYKYPTKIFPEPQHLYFYPLNRSYLKVRDYELNVSPKPAGSAQRIDIENNSYQQCWFNELTDKLTIKLAMTLEVSQLNQFNFLAEQQPKTNYSKAIELYLGDKLTLSSQVLSWLDQIDNSDPTLFVGTLCGAIHDKLNHTTSYISELLDPNKCFVADAGSCRDLAWMMIQMLRSKGYPARFVSGYSYNPEIIGHELHAWVEVWIAGAGWIGLDPSSGLFITELYIPLATSYHPVNTLPVQGSFRGKGVAELTTSVDISIVE